MATNIRIKRRLTGEAGAPTSLLAGELAHNFVDEKLYIGNGTSIEVIGGKGAFVDKATAQTITGKKTFSGGIDAGSVVIENVATPVASTDAASKGYVDTAISNVIDAAPDALNTLNELAAALNDDANFASTVANSLSAIEGDITAIESAASTLSGRVDTAESDIDSLESRATAVEGRATTLEEEMDAVEGRLDTVEGDISSINSDASALEGRVSTAESDIDALESRATDIETAATTLEGRVTTVEDEKAPKADPVFTGVAKFEKDGASTEINTGAIFVDNLKKIDLINNEFEGYWSITRLNVQSEPTEENDAVRKQDLDAVEDKVDALQGEVDGGTF